MFLSKYGAARHIYIPIVKRAVVDHAVSADWTPAAGDVKISKDGGAAANVTNLPSAIAMGNSAVWDFSLTATEMEAAQIMVTVADSATKAVEDTGFIVETYGHASAQHAFDLDTSSVAQTGDNFARLGAPAGASVSADVAAVQSDTNDLQARLPAALTADGNIKADTLRVSGTAQTAGDIIADTNDIQSRLPAALIGGRMDSDVEAINNNADAADILDRSARNIARITVGVGSSTTSVVSSACAPSGAVADQFKGRILIFDKDTTTAALRGQATDITASSNAATPTFTVTALTTAPASGDTATIQ